MPRRIHADGAQRAIHARTVRYDADMSAIKSIGAVAAILVSVALVSTGAAVAVLLPIASGIREDVREIRNSVETVTQSLHAVDTALAVHKRIGATAAHHPPFD